MVKKKHNHSKKSTDFLFPPTLEDKEISVNKISSKESDKASHFHEKSTFDLNEYLKNKNPGSFVNAIKKKPEFLHEYLAGKGTSLDVELYALVKDTLDKSHHIKSQHHIDKHHSYQKRLFHGSRKYVDIETIVRETLNWWREIQNFTGTYEEAEIAKKYLEKIAPVEIFKRNETVITEGGEFLIHIDENKKHTHPCITYISPTEFISRWEKVYSAFDKLRSKKRYKHHKDDALKKSDALKAIRFLGNELSDYEVNKLDLTNTRTKTASYIKIYHQDRCPVCIEEGISDSMILRRLSQAHKELKNISNH